MKIKIFSIMDYVGIKEMECSINTFLKEVDVRFVSQTDTIDTFIVSIFYEEVK